MIDPITTLWRSVLLAGLKESDPAWLGSKDFQLVCTLAGLKAEWVLRCHLQHDDKSSDMAQKHKKPACAGVL
jgi:hypothetical protein